MILAPPLLDLICIRTLDIRLLCFCRHFVDQAMTCAKMNLSDFVSSVAWPGMNDDMKDCGWREALVWQHSVDDVEGRVLNQGFIRDGYGERKWMIILFQTALEARAFRLAYDGQQPWCLGVPWRLDIKHTVLRMSQHGWSMLYRGNHQWSCPITLRDRTETAKQVKHCVWCGCNCR